MNVIWGVVLIVLTLPAWGGQMISAFSPELAARLGLSESESDVDPAFFGDVRGEAIWDSVVLWPLPVAGILLLLDNPWWAYFGLVGGGMYFYFAGRGIVVRIVMRRRRIRIGTPGTVRVIHAALILWGLTALISIVMAVSVLP